MIFLVFLHTVHENVIFLVAQPYGSYWNERSDSAAKAALQKYVSECMVAYTVTYQYIGQTYAICGRANGTRLLSTSFMLQNP